MNKDVRQMIDQRLKALDPADREAAEETQADTDLLMHSIMSQGRSARRSGVLRHLSGGFRLGRFAPAAVAFAVVLAVSAVVTTPGQAVSSWVGQRLGIEQSGGETSPRISEAGEQPSLESLREFGHQGSPAGGQPAVVVASGATPHGRHYELIAYRAKEAGAGDGSEPICFELDFPEARSIGTFTCEMPAPGSSLGYVEATESELPGSSFSYAAGLAGSNVAAVDLTLSGHPTEAQLVDIPPAVLETLGVSRRLKFFIAFFPAKTGGSLEVTARDAGGSPLAHASARLG
jgi:hypothetical protein